MKKVYLFLLIIILSLTYIGYLNLNNNDDAISVSGRVSDVRKKPGEEKIKIMTYNIHHGVGLDNRLDLDRIARIIKESDADIIGLNEVDRGMVRTRFRDQVAILADKLGLNYAFGPNLKLGVGSYGNAILSRFPISSVKNYSLPGNFFSEPRGVLSARVNISDQFEMSVLITHLSLEEGERLEQLNWLEDYTEGLTGSYILMGDHNTEFESSIKLKPLLTGVKSFPAFNPDKGIDLYFASKDIELIDGYTITSQGSDHLPVVVEIKPPV